MEVRVSRKEMLQGLPRNEQVMHGIGCADPPDRYDITRPPRRATFIEPLYLRTIWNHRTVWIQGPHVCGIDLIIGGDSIDLTQEVVESLAATCRQPKRIDKIQHQARARFLAQPGNQASGRHFGEVDHVNTSCATNNQ